MDTIKFSADAREILGRKVKKLRREGKVPANIFGKDFKSQSIVVDLKEFLKVFKEAGETKVIELTLSGKTIPTLVHTVQKDPIDESIIHIDFRQVNLKQKVKAQVPVHYEGESPAEKQGVGTVVKYVDEIEIEALPTDIPENFVLNLALLEKIDDQITIANLKYDKNKIEILDDLEKIIVKVEELRTEEEVVTTAETPATEEESTNVAETGTSEESDQVTE